MSDHCWTDGSATCVGSRTSAFGALISSFRQFSDLSYRSSWQWHLRPEGPGACAYLWSIIAILAPFTVFGLEQIGLRHLVTSPARQHAILVSALRHSVALVGIALASTAIALLGGRAGASPGLGALAAPMLFFMPSEAINGVFKARERMAWIAAPRIAVGCIAAAVTGAIALASGVLVDFVAIRVSEAALLAAGILIALRLADDTWPRSTVDRALVRSFFVRGFTPVLGVPLRSRLHAHRPSHAL